jgi:mono/diheme cytochrome c family protein
MLRTNGSTKHPKASSSERINPGSEKLKGIALAVVALVFLSDSLHTASSAKLARAGFPQKVANTNVLFTTNCASCHGKDGRARTFKAKFNHARDLTDPKWQAAITDEHMYESILHGKEKMPAFGKKLSENEVAALVTYVRALRR